MPWQVLFHPKNQKRRTGIEQVDEENQLEETSYCKTINVRVRISRDNQNREIKWRKILYDINFNW